MSEHPASESERVVSDASPAAAPPEKTSVWEDFIDILYAPAAVFARRERGSFWPPMLLVALLVGALGIAGSGPLQPVMDAEFQRGVAAAMKANPQLTPDMMERGRAFNEGLIRYGTFVFLPIAIFVIGLVLWGVGKFVDATESLHAAVVVAAYSYVPKVLEIVVAIAQALLMDPAKLDGRFRLALGPARFLDPDTTSPILLAIVGRLDLFTIWVTVLLAIGLSVTGRISRGRAAVAAAVVWIVGALPGLLGALRQ